MNIQSRYLLKTLTWRIIALTTTFIIVFMITGHFKGSIGITLVSNFVKTILYYLHELAWNGK